MNKFFALALFALVAVASAANIPDETFSESYLNPDDSEETASLIGDMKVFSDFCIRSRDHVTGSIKSTSNNLASGIFQTIMNAGEAAGRNVLTFQHIATDKLGNQIAHPDAPIDFGAGGAIDIAIAEGQQAIKEQQTQPQTFFQAIMTTVGVSKNVIAAHVAAGFEAVKAKLGVNQALAMLEKGCGLMSQYEGELREMFESAKGDIAAAKPELASVTFEQVPCITSRRVIRADGVCQFARAAQKPVTKMLQTRA